MGFEESALVRLRRYREETERSLELVREAEEAARRFAGRLFDGLEYTAALGREVGFEVETTREKATFALGVSAGPGMEAGATFALLQGAAAETDEDLMHEELSRYVLDPAGYSSRILGWSEQVGENLCQIFAVYRDGVWKTKGIFVEKTRGRVDDPDEVLKGFCLRVLGRLIDLAVPSGGAGRRWAVRPYTLADFRNRKRSPTETRWLR
jgi:hypothetical protein